MAKISKSVSFKNATISISSEEMTITEYTKDDSKTYNLEKILKEWNQVDGISLTIKQDNDIPADE